MQQVLQWINGDLRIPVSVSFDKVIIPNFGNCHRKIVRDPIDPIEMIHHQLCSVLIYPHSSIHEKNRAKLLLSELVNRGYIFSIDFDYHIHSDKWVLNTYKRSGLLTMDVFRKTYGSGRKISKL